MPFRLCAYFVIWLDVTLFLAEPTLLRFALGFCGVMAGAGMRILWNRAAAFAGLALVGVAAAVLLLVSANSLYEVGRTLLGGAFGVFAVYCSMRALRG